MWDVCWAEESNWDIPGHPRTSRNIYPRSLGLPWTPQGQMGPGGHSTSIGQLMAITDIYGGGGGGGG